jgi:hypothetical protein
MYEKYLLSKDILIDLPKHFDMFKKQKISKVSAIKALVLNEIKSILSKRLLLTETTIN